MLSLWVVGPAPAMACQCACVFLSLTQLQPHAPIPKRHLSHHLFDSFVLWRDRWPLSYPHHPACFIPLGPNPAHTLSFSTTGPLPSLPMGFFILGKADRIGPHLILCFTVSSDEEMGPPLKILLSWAHAYAPICQWGYLSIVVYPQLPLILCWTPST